MAAPQVFRRPMVDLMGFRKDELIGTGSITLDVSAKDALQLVSELPIDA